MAMKAKKDDLLDEALTEEYCLHCLACEMRICRIGIRTVGAYQGDLIDQVGQTTWPVPARRLVCRSEDLGDAVPIICDGWAARYINHADGTRRILSFILPGELISATTFFPFAMSWYVESITDLQYRTFEREELNQLVWHRPDLRETVLHSMLQEQIRSDELIVDLGRRSAEERIARLTVRLMERMEGRGLVPDDLQQIPFPLRHHHIADATGLTAVHVSKIISTLHRDKILSIGRRHLSILDLPALRRLAGA
jgi:CRP/FNR family transcriptional regulator, anaerobic regulatory protein